MALDLVLKNFETKDIPYNSDQLWTSSIIIIDKFYIYSLTYAGADRNGLYVNDYKTDIEHRFGDSLFRFKDKIYIIHPSGNTVSGSIYNFQTTEPYLVKEKDLNTVSIGASLDFTRKHQYGQDTFIFASGYANLKVYVFFIENEEIKYITIDVEEYTGAATEDWFQPNIIYVDEKYLKNQNITESGIYYLIKEGTYSSDSAIYSGIRDDGGQFKTGWRKCETNFTSVNSYVYKQDDTIFLLQFEPSSNETHIGYYSIERRNDDYTIYFNNILEVNKENEMWIFSLSYCENPIGKQNFDFYTDTLYADISASTVHKYIAKLSFEVIERQPLEFHVETNGLEFQQILYAYVNTEEIQTNPPFVASGPINNAMYVKGEENGLLVYAIIFDQREGFNFTSTSARVSGVQIDDIKLIENENVPINIFSGTHTVKLIPFTPFSMNLIDENNEFTLYDYDPLTGTVGEKNPDVFKHITVDKIAMVGVMRNGDYYLFGFIPPNPSGPTEVFYGAIKYNSPSIKMSSITINGQNYPYEEPDGIIVENLSISNTTSIYIHTPALKPVAIINSNGEKTYARIWSN